MARPDSHASLAPIKRAAHWRGWSACAAAMLLAGCSPAAPTGWSGYAEGDYVYVASPVAGRLRALSVRAGDAVVQGAPLFTLDDDPERDALDAAQAQRDAAAAQSANLQTGKRPDEVAQVQAQLAQARAQAALARSEAARMAVLVAQAAVSRSEADTARTTAAAADQRVSELEAAGLPVLAGGRAPFVLVDVSALGFEVPRRLAERGFAVRSCDSFPGLGPGWVRLAVRDASTSRQVAAALGGLR